MPIEVPITALERKLQENFPNGVAYGHWLLLDDNFWTDTFTVNTGTENCTADSGNHDRVDLTRIRFTTTGTLPTSSPQIVAGTDYYMRTVSGANFQVSETPTGSIIDFTGTGTGTHTATEQPMNADDDKTVLIQHELSHAQYTRRSFTPGVATNDGTEATLPVVEEIYTPTAGNMVFRFLLLMKGSISTLTDTTGDTDLFNDFGSTQTIIQDEGRIIRVTIANNSEAA